jgi:chemotaxis protein CheD
MNDTASTSRPTSTASAAHLARLKAAPRKPGEASFFWFETHFQSIAVKVLPGEYFVATEDILIMTTLGSCIACYFLGRESMQSDIRDHQERRSRRHEWEDQE